VDLKESKELKPDDLVGPSFEIIKTNHPTLLKMKNKKTPLELIHSWDIITDKDKKFTLGWVTSIIKDGDLIAIRQDAPRKKNVVTILKVLKEENMKLKQVNESLENLKKILKEGKDTKKYNFKVAFSVDIIGDMDEEEVKAELMRLLDSAGTRYIPRDFPKDDIKINDIYVVASGK
jgi:hypothetical protein